jgi:D-sedoheptulose 7-phosphate isomerase
VRHKKSSDAGKSSGMTQKAKLEYAIASLREGAELRMRISDECGQMIVTAAILIQNCLRADGKILLFGNGGSAADAQHMAAEFVGRFVQERRALPAIALTTDSSILTAVGNDYGFDRVFSRQIEALGRPNDVAIGISTSGNSPNILAGIERARSKQMKTIGLSGKDGGRLAKSCDVSIVIPSTNTARIQECHITVGHIFCELIESELTGIKARIKSA